MLKIASESVGLLCDATNPAAVKVETVSAFVAVKSSKLSMVWSGTAVIKVVASLYVVTAIASPVHRQQIAKTAQSMLSGAVERCR